MRLDKYLKVSRIIKRRPLAKEVCDSGKIEVNGRVAKASNDVKPGDIIVLELGRKRLKVKIVDIKDTVPAKEAATLYEILEETKLQND